VKGNEGGLVVCWGYELAFDEKTAYVSGYFKKRKQFNQRSEHSILGEKQPIPTSFIKFAEKKL
jgi:hypothetical protein